MPPTPKDHCECPNTGILDVPGHHYFYDPEKELPFVEHEPHLCRCINDLQVYLQSDNVERTLCSCCFLSSDKRLS